MIRKSLVGISVLALVASLSDCAVGPDFKRPTPPLDTSYGSAPSRGETAASPGAGADRAASEGIPSGDIAQHFVAELDIPAQWWTLFQSPKLNALVEQAIKGNPNMTAARASLRQAHELYLAERATFWPTAQGTFNAQRAKNAVGTIANPTSMPQQNPYYNLYTTQLNVSYMPDVFGGTRRAVEAARAQDDEARFQLEATYLTLSSNVVVAAISEASLRGQVTATQRLLELQHQITEKMRKQRTVGTASNLDVLNQEAAEAQTAATLAPLQKQLGQTRDQLTALLGKLPAEEPADTFQLDELTLPADLPVSLPAKLVEQRPDVRQAEENLHFASAEAGVAIADMLPQIAITGNLGSSAFDVKDLFKTGTGFWAVGASLTQTLFDAGALLHKHRAADAALDQAGAQYRAAVILACQNVADTLRALQSDADALKADAEAARAAKAAFDLASRQLDLGSVSFVPVMNAETTYQQAELALAQARGNRYSDTAGLFQALGGGWWNRPKGTHL
jgi:NodT family efflux transporter outer membrane factor (OMF) lipoprotein